MSTRTLWIASASPRRQRLLREAGFDPRSAPPDLDDDDVAPVVGDPVHRAAALAWLKASRVDGLLEARGDHGGVLVAADTVCLAGERTVGKPLDEGHAEAILRAFGNAAHRTCSGVCILDRDDGRRWIFADLAEVRLGTLTESQIQDHLRHEAWRGKAGGYNFNDQVDAGWPLSCVGDRTSVMGLPMRRVTPLLRRLLGGEQRSCA